MPEFSKHPPRLARWLLRRLTRYQENYSITGDVEEVFFLFYKEDGYLKAALWYWHQTLASLFIYTLYMLRLRAVLLKNYFKIAFRSYYRNKGTTVVNLIGLAIGVAAFFIIMLYLSYEKSYDKFFLNSKNIYRIQYRYLKDGEERFSTAVTVPAIAGALKQNFSEVIDYARLTREFLEYCAFSNDKNISFRENRVFVATPSFLSIFDFPLLKGERETALSEPLQIVLTESSAKKYFPETDPMGKILTYNGKHDFEVTGVCQDVPRNSHIKFDVLLSYQSLPFIAHISSSGEEAETDWNWNGFYSYVALQPGTDPELFQAKVDKWLERTRGEEWRKNRFRQEFPLFPLEDIHLFSHMEKEMEPEQQGNGEALGVLAVVAYFILALAWINYINLSTSRSLERAQEVGIRKVSGASRKELIKQFFLEYIGLSLVAAFLAAILALQAKSYITQITGAELSFRYMLSSGSWRSLVWVFIGGTLTAGLYPASVLSAYKPVAVLKGKLIGSTGGIRLRRFLVTTQLAVAIAMIGGALIAYQQIFYILHKDPGIDIEQILVLHAPGTNMPPQPIFSNNFSAFKEDINSYGKISDFTTTTSVPGKEVLWSQFIRRIEDDPKQAFSIKSVGIDFDFVTTFGVELLTGRNFSKNFTTDENAMLLNETAVSILDYSGPEDAIGREVSLRRRTYNIIGVLKDYNQLALKALPVPMIYLLSPNRGFVALKIAAEDVENTIGSIKKKWQNHFPGIPFDYFFLDESFNMHYQNDRRFSQIFTIFSGLTIIIACLGLFGLASLNTVQRTKEIGIRKALGASSRSIYSLLSKEFMRLVFYAGLIGIPLTYYLMSKWLGNFIYRIDLEWWHFIFSGIFVAVFVLLTISYQTFTAAAAAPVKALRYE